MGAPFLLQKNALANGNLAAKLLMVAIAYSNCMCELRSRSHERAVVGICLLGSLLKYLFLLSGKNSDRMFKAQENTEICTLANITTGNTLS